MYFFSSFLIWQDTIDLNMQAETEYAVPTAQLVGS